MLTYVRDRVVQAVAVVLAAYTVAFVVLYALPGDPVVALFAGGDAGNAPDLAELQRLREQFGFDRPLVEQYVTRLGHALTGDLGASLKTGRPVAAMIAEALPQTVALVLAALVLAVVLGVALALAATISRARWLQQLLLGLPSVGIAMPTFWVGLVLVQVLSFQLRLLPAIGNDGIESLLMPAVTLALPGAATIAQVLAKSMRTALAEPYVVTALATGASRPLVHLRDALRNAALPALTVAGVIIANLFGGSVVVESVFSRSGLGQVTVQAVLSHDIPVVQGVVVLGAVIFVVASLLVDLAYPLIDPRIRTTTTKAGRR